MNIGGTGQAVSSLSGGGTIAGSSGWLTVNGGGTYGGEFSGTVGLIKSGSGTLSLTSGSDSLGYISISGGTVNMTGADTAGSTTVSSGTLIVGGSLSVGVGGTTITGGTLQIGTGSTTLHQRPYHRQRQPNIRNSTSTTFAGTYFRHRQPDAGGGSGTRSPSPAITRSRWRTTINQPATNCKSATAAPAAPSAGTALYDNGSLVFDSSMWTTCSASINGGGTLTQEGSGTLTLTGSDTYSGGTTINPYSTLQVGNGTTGGLGCTSSITNYGSLVLDTNAYYLGAISGGGSLTVSGGTVYLNAANTYSGVTIWAGGTLELCGTAASISYNVFDYGTLAFGCSGTTTYSGVISGGGSLTQNSGTLILTGANTYGGGTTIMGQHAADRRRPKRLHRLLHPRHRLRNPGL